MNCEIATVLCGDQKPDWPRKDAYRSRIISIDNSANEKSPCECYQIALDMCNSDVLIYVHSDVTIHESNWDGSVMALFDNPQCVAVGLGGATGLGSPNLYKKPYNIWNLARSGYASNQTDAEVHGARFTGSKRVAVLDAFFMAVRCDWLRTRRTLKPHREGIDKDGVMDYEMGWPTSRLSHHMLDGWLACEAASDGKEIWMTGISATHHGGGTSVTDKYAKAPWLQGGSREADHEIPHRWIYDSYRQVLPIQR